MNLTFPQTVSLSLSMRFDEFPATHETTQKHESFYCVVLVQLAMNSFVLKKTEKFRKIHQKFPLQSFTSTPARHPSIVFCRCGRFVFRHSLHLYFTNSFSLAHCLQMHRCKNKKIEKRKVTTMNDTPEWPAESKEKSNCGNHERE